MSSNRIDLGPQDLEILAQAKRQSLNKAGSVFVEAVMAMGTSETSVILFRLRISDQYNTASTVAAYQNGLRV